VVRLVAVLMAGLAAVGLREAAIATQAAPEVSAIEIGSRCESMAAWSVRHRVA